MKKYGFCLLFLFFTIFFDVSGQRINGMNYGNSFYNRAKIIMISDKYEKNYKLLQDYTFRNTGFKLIDEKYTANAAKLILIADSTSFLNLLNFLPTIGNIQYKKITTGSSLLQVKELESEISHTEEKITKYQTMLSQNDTFEYSKKRLQSLIKQNEDMLESNRTTYKKMLSGKNYFIVELDINNSFIQPGSVDDEEIGLERKWVNMPGAEFSLLRVENPKKGISSNFYSGLQVKYIFTKGKDYIQLGAWKSTSSALDSSTFKELFLFSFGQDFYSKRWGKGSRKFLNLYTGYNTGILLLSDGNNRVILPQLSPAIGLDIFKTKHVLLDTRVNYFLPISSKYYENLRGLTFSASFNFVF